MPRPRPRSRTKNYFCLNLSNFSDENRNNYAQQQNGTDRTSWAFQTRQLSPQTSFSTTEGGSSSSSSLGWSDEYEGSTTKILYEELKKMDRVLKGEQPIPAHYDKGEYEQWMEKFPNISIFDETPVNSVQDITEKLEKETDIRKIHHNGPPILHNKDCDNVTLERNIRNKMNMARISEVSAAKLLNQRGTIITRKKSSDQNTFRNKNIFTTFNNSKSWDVDTFLKISSINNPVERQQSSKSLLNRRISKEYPDSSLEFDSLPFLEADEEPSEHKQLLFPHNKRHLNVPSSRRKHSDHLVLPPIKIGDQFRSISATPRPISKTFSALSMKSNVMREQKKLRNVLSGFSETPVKSGVVENGFFVER